MDSKAWVKLLQKVGDNIERKGIDECGLGDLFPRYAEFWGRFILPNRSEDPSKLKDGFNPQFENIFNTHYSIFFQLTTAFHQIQHLNDPLLDIATPLYHLGAVVDLTERLLVNVLKVKGELVVTKLDRNQFAEKALKYYDEEYEKKFEEFLKTYRPIQFTLYNVSDLFKENVPESKKFSAIADKVRQYRNTSIHSLQPIRVNLNNEIYIPKISSLHKYKKARWSSDLKSLDMADFDLAEKVIKELADRLTLSINDLWSPLISEAAAIEEITRIPSPITKGINSEVNPYQVDQLPNNPSGYQIQSINPYSGGTMTTTLPPDRDVIPPNDL